VIEIRRARTSQPLLELFGPPPYVVPYHCMWNEENSQVMGGFIWSHYGGGTIQMHQAGRGPWVTRRLLRAAFTYCFDELGVQVILGMQKSSQQQAYDLAIRVGFQQLGVIPKVGICVLTMVREQCLYLPNHEKVA
jgi:L-amino acid N-acyltransferase YncA